MLRRFKVRIHAVDSTVLQLVANCMDWAKHRRRKAAAKLHLRLDLHSFLPPFAVVDTATHHDNKRAREVCAGIAEGEIVVFDKAYVDFEHLARLDACGVWWVTRAKDNMRCRAVKTLTRGHENFIKDQLVTLMVGKHAGMRVRRVEAWVEVDNEWRMMVFITNHLEWSPRSMCDLYRRRRDIEVFFKQVKQSLKLSSFLGHSANAVRWQVDAALLVYVLLRHLAHLSQWGAWLHAALRGDTPSALGATRPAGIAQILWDSIGAHACDRRAGSGLVAGFGTGHDVLPWDSMGRRIPGKARPSWKSRNRPALQSVLQALQNQGSRTVMPRLWDDCEITSNAPSWLL